MNVNVQPSAQPEGIGLADPFALMADFVGNRDRSAPPVFVGRKAQLAALKGAAERMAKNKGVTGLTPIVQGVAGAGKTSLSKELARLHNGKFINGKQVWFASLKPMNLAGNANDLCASISNSLRRMAGESGIERAFRHGMSALSERFARKSGSEVWEGLQGLRAGHSCADCFSAYAEARLWPEDALIVLVLDEAQNLIAHWDDREKVMDALDALHNGGHSANIMLACFGLQNAADVLGEFGLSRLASGFPMDICTLDPGQGREVLERTMDHLGLLFGNPRWRAHLELSGHTAESWAGFRKRLIEELEAGCSDFPQHLNAGLRAACQTFIDRRSDFGPDRAEGLVDEVKGRLTGLREAYYSSRLGPELRGHRDALGAVAKAADAAGEIDRDDAALAIMAAANAKVPERLDFERSEALVSLALQRGVLRIGLDGEGNQDASLIRPPAIPSMTASLSAHFEGRLANGASPALKLAEQFGFHVPQLKSD